MFNEASIEPIYNDLKNGVRETYSLNTSAVIGGKTIKESLDYIDDLIKKMSYNEYLTFRDTKLTKELGTNIDKLDLATIRKEYLGGEH